MNKPLSPCKDCEKRFVGCHSTCEKYQTFHEENIKYLNFVASVKRNRSKLDEFAYTQTKRHVNAAKRKAEKKARSK